jgi:hypothetical protein
MTDYMGEWTRFLGTTNAPATRWVSPQEDKVRGVGYFKISYESAWARNAADLEAGAVPDTWRNTAETHLALKLTALQAADGAGLYATSTGVGKTTLPITVKTESNYTDAINLGTEFGWSRESHGWVFKIAEGTYVLGQSK